MNAQRFRQRYGPWALVTGASSGIGAEFARQIAALGLNVILVARREERLRALAAELEQAHAIAACVVALDLAREDFLPALQAATAEREVGLLVNNAGFSITGPMLDNALERELRLLYVNCRAGLILAHAYGREMQQRGRGGIIFVSSVTSFAATPLWTHYAASKVYGRYLAEGLAGELRGRNVDVLALCPGTTRTEFQDVAAVDEFMAMDADVVVADALKSLGHKRRTIPGFFYKVGIFATRFLPSAFNSFAFSRIIASIQRA